MLLLQTRRAQVQSQPRAFWTPAKIQRAEYAHDDRQRYHHMISGIKMSDKTRELSQAVLIVASAAAAHQGRDVRSEVVEAQGGWLLQACQRLLVDDPGHTLRTGCNEAAKSELPPTLERLDIHQGVMIKQRI